MERDGVLSVTAVLAIVAIVAVVGMASMMLSKTASNLVTGAATSVNSCVNGCH